MDRKPKPHDLLVALLLVQGLLDRRSEAFFQPFGLTGAQFNILNLLACRDGQMDQATVVEMLLVGKSSISIVLNRMVRADLVRRKEHAKDRRQTVLTLTAKGWALWRKICPSYEAGVNEIFETLKMKDRESFLEILETLYSALRRSGGPSADTFPPAIHAMLAHLAPPKEGGLD